MTDEELSLKILNCFGWRKLFPNGGWTLDPVGEERHWIKESEMPNMVTDPAMTVMLIQALISAGKCVFIGASYLEIFSSEPGTCEPEIQIDRSGPIGRAVAESFAKSKGLI